MERKEEERRGPDLAIFLVDKKNGQTRQENQSIEVHLHSQGPRFPYRDIPQSQYICKAEIG